MALASSVTVTSPQGRQITWTFDASHEVGQFVNGDWWVRENTPGAGVRVLSISPYTTDGTRFQSGTMLNPDPLTGGNGRAQGYDSTMYQGFAATYWTPSLCENISLPKTYTVGSSLCSSVSNPSASAIPQLFFSAVLTVVASIPDPTAFRPPYCPGTTIEKAPQWTTGNIDWGKLVSTFSWDSLMEPERPYADVIQNVSGFVIDHARGYLSRFALSSETGFGYGRDYTANLGNAILGIVSDLGVSQKQDLAIQLVQKGIDNFYLLKRGHYWPADGGHMAGRKFPILLAGLLLGEQEMLDIGADYVSQVGSTPNNYFGEDGQTFTVEETSPGVYNYGNGGYGAGDVGLAEWGFRHYENSSQDRRDWGADQYRRCCTANTWIAQVYACKALGLRSAWGHEPFFLYQERFMDTMPNDPFTATVYPNWNRSWFSAHADVWDAHYATLGDPGPPASSDLGVVNIQNDSGFTRQVMTRQTVPALQGQLPNASTKIVTGEGEWVAWEPLQTENGGAATWGDGSYKYALCWVPTTVPGNTTKAVALTVDNGASEPSFALHSAVAAQVGTWLDGGSATGWTWSCDVAPSTARSASRSIFAHGTVTTLISNANVRRVKWFTRSGDSRWVWEHYFEFYRGVPIAKFWSNPVFSYDQTTDLTDYLENGVHIASTGCFPSLLDPGKFSNPNGGTFSSWSRRWGSYGNVCDAQGLTPAEGDLVFIDVNSPGGASQADIDTCSAALDIEETSVTTRFRQAKSFGPFGYVPELPSQFTSASAAIANSETTGRAARTAIESLPDARPQRIGWISDIMSLPQPSGTGSQSDHGLTKWHRITVLGVPTWLTPLKVARGREWGRPTFTYESGAVAADGSIVSVANHPNLCIWDGRPFEGDLLGKLTRNIDWTHIRPTNQTTQSLTRVTNGGGVSFTASTFTHHTITAGSGITVTLPVFTNPSAIIIDNDTVESVDVQSGAGHTLNGGAGITLGPFESVLVGKDNNQTNWTTSNAYVYPRGYDRQHYSINLVTHHFLLTGDPISGRLMDHYRENLRGTLRDFNYVNGGGNFTIGSFEADRQVGRCSIAAAWIESISPQVDFRNAINSYYDTSLGSGLASSPQYAGLFNGTLAGFTRHADLIAPGHDLTGLEMDDSSINADGVSQTVAVRSWTPWQRGIMMAGMWAWYKASGNARSLELTRLFGNSGISFCWFEDRQTVNGVGVAAGGYYSHYHALRFDTPGGIGNMPPVSQLPPNSTYSQSAGGKGPDIGGGICAFRVWVDGVHWCWPSAMIARQIMLDDGIPDQGLMDKANAICRGFLQTYYSPGTGSNDWGSTADNNLDWTTAVEDPFSQNYTGGPPNQTVDPEGVGSESQIGTMEAILSSTPISGNNGIIIVRGR